ncbi:tripartite motif-containing protein 2-like isoform X2 [Acanthaster planci]|uniref:Tripartite motif-containing protein 2-like isoform X2 n=1 Tax=Acanthaster planci TaxID=133434 RepID=A0A8B7XEM6_ACAPL|nr:tripartite motif-containing protein 2-like isoform X2 [Acanthaster planci]
MLALSPWFLDYCSLVKPDGVWLSRQNMAEGKLCRSTLRDFSDKHLLCSICYEMYRKPKTLKCLHSFCEDCLMNYVKSAKGNIKCPVCRKTTLLPRRGVRDLPSDFRLTSMTDMVLHTEGTSIPTCPTHAGNMCGVYCETCREVMCLRCLKESHTAHEFDEVAGAVTAAKQHFVEDILPQCETSLTKIVGILETVSKTEQDLRTTFRNIRDQIAGKTQREIKRVLEANDRILLELDKIQAEREQSYASIKEDLLSQKRDVTLAIDYSTGATETNDYHYLRRFPKLSSDFFELIDRPLNDIECTVSSVEFLPSSEADDICLGTLATSCESLRLNSTDDIVDSNDGDNDEGEEDGPRAHGDGGCCYGNEDGRYAVNDVPGDTGSEKTGSGSQETFIGRFFAYVSARLMPPYI